MPVILMVQLPAGRHCFKRRHGMGPTISAEMHRPLLTTVYRIARVVTVKHQLLTTVEVDAFIPERYRTHIAPSDIRWIAPDVFRTRAYWIDNKKSRVLGAFIESGDSEWDVRGMS
ncbi:bacteriophage portal protein [Burkholderia pseudomallei]|nr:bacteriophage portal protein [Burkholderia pseudomallei]CAK0346801.1 bacteriophage portal protein [Burkholderia pseudomallei]